MAIGVGDAVGGGVGEGDGVGTGVGVGDREGEESDGVAAMDAPRVEASVLRRRRSTPRHREAT